MNKHIKLLAFFFGFLTLMFSNQLFSEEHSHNCHTHEIGIGAVPTYLINEEEVAFGLHLHYVYSFEHTDFGIGLGYERIFDEHGHNTLGIAFNYKPIENLSFNLIPGLAFGDDGFDHSEFAFHIESLYEFKIGEVHIGPLFEYAFESHGNHISFGIHLGIGF